MKCAHGIPLKSILDVGCGEKPYRIYFPGANHYVGIDKRSASADVKGVGEYLPFRGNVFDTAICTQVLEHAENPVKVLQELNRILTGNGVLILSTHGFWIEGHEKPDYWRWTLLGLHKIFKESGFNVIESHSMEPYSSFFQFASLFIPANLTGKPLQALMNSSGRVLKALRGGPNLCAVHVIKATKNPVGMLEKII
jgi:SAM-dependent methyltransferase